VEIIRALAVPLVVLLEEMLDLKGVQCLEIVPQLIVIYSGVQLPKIRHEHIFEKIILAWKKDICFQGKPRYSLPPLKTIPFKGNILPLYSRFLNVDHSSEI
jgi:hypothetical protein